MDLVVSLLAFRHFNLTWLTFSFYQNARFFLLLELLTFGVPSTHIWVKVCTTAFKYSFRQRLVYCSLPLLANRAVGLVSLFSLRTFHFFVFMLNYCLVYIEIDIPVITCTSPSHYYGSTLGTMTRRDHIFW